jgi:hypothetical protein
MKLQLIISLYFLTLTVHATETLLIGGGGDPKGATTIFDASLVALSHKKKELNLNITSYFNGGHLNTEEILEGDLKVKNQRFTSKNYESAVESYIKKIETGAIKPGEKLMVILDTHGAAKTSAHRTHSIATSGAEIKDYDNLGNNDHDSVDRLFDLAKIAEEKGVKLAILDFSCHSGNSLALANDKTCVISSSGPNHYGYSNFPASFYENMSPGKNLEDVFLQTRLNYGAPSFPMISSPAGEELNQDIYNLISPYINIVTQNGAADKLSPYLNSIFEGNNLCKRENDYAILEKKIEDFQKISGVLRSKYYGNNDLVEELKSYKDLQDNYIKKLEETGLPLFNKVETISYGQEVSETRPRKIGKDGKKIKSITPAPRPLEESLTWREIVTQYPLSNRDYFQEQLQTVKDPGQKRDFLNAIDKYTKIELKRQEILKKYPNIAQAGKSLETLKNDYQKIWEKASRVTELTNKYYDALYREKSKLNPDEKNPCRDFTL